MSGKEYRYKHLRGRHDQRDHNRWPAGYIPQSSSGRASSSNRRLDLIAERAEIPSPTGGLVAMTQNAILANRQPWNVGVPNNAFAGIIQKRGGNPVAITQNQQEVANEKRKIRFNPSWSIKAFRRSGRPRQGVMKIKLDADKPEAIGIPGIAGVDYLWGQRPTTNNIGSNDSWLTHDSYVMPLVADALTTALGMHKSTTSAMLKNGTTVESAVQGVPLDMSNPSIIEDMKNGKINIEDQALVDLILGRANTTDRDYIIVQTPDGYALRSSNYNNAGLSTTNQDFTRQEITTRNNGNQVVNVKNSSNQFLTQFMLKNKLNGSSSKVKFSQNDMKYSDTQEMSGQSFYDIRFSPETLHKLASAQYAIEYDPKIPDSVKEQVRERIQYILGSAYHLNQGVDPVKLDAVSSQSKNNFVNGMSNNTKAEMESAGKTANLMSSRLNEFTEQPHRGLYENAFPGAVEFFQDFAKQSSVNANQVQMLWRFLQQKYANVPPSQIDLRQDEKILDDITNLSMPMLAANSLYENVLRFSAMSTESSQVRSRITSQLRKMSSENSMVYNRFINELNALSAQQMNLMREIRQYVENPQSMFSGLGYMTQNNIQAQINNLMNQFYSLENDAFRILKVED